MTADIFEAVQAEQAAEKNRIGLAALVFHAKAAGWKPVDVTIDIGTDHAVIHFAAQDRGATYAHVRGKFTALGNLDSETRARLRDLMKHRASLKIFEQLYTANLRTLAEDLSESGLPVRTVAAAIGVCSSRAQQILERARETEA